MCSVERQKRGLPHVRILMWLTNKLRPNQIVKVTRAEIPDESDPE